MCAPALPATFVSVLCCLAAPLGRALHSLTRPLTPLTSTPPLSTTNVHPSPPRLQVPRHPAAALLRHHVPLRGGHRAACGLRRARAGAQGVGLLLPGPGPGLGCFARQVPAHLPLAPCPLAHARSCTAFTAGHHARLGLLLPPRGGPPGGRALAHAARHRPLRARLWRRHRCLRCARLHRRFVWEGAGGRRQEEEGGAGSRRCCLLGLAVSVLPNACPNLGSSSLCCCRGGALHLPRLPGLPLPSGNHGGHPGGAGG